MSMNKADTLNRNRLMIAGVQKNYGANSTILVDGVPTKQKDVIAALQAPEDAANATTTAEAAFHQAVAEEKAANVAADTMYQGLKSYFLSVNAKQPQVLADYGLAPVVRKQPTAATKAAAAVKAQATRAARGTKGKNQRKAIKAPVAATPAPATPATTPSKS
jgi:hypothetical protein